MSNYGNRDKSNCPTESGTVDLSQGRDSTDSRASGTAKDQIGQETPSCTDAREGVNPNDGAAIVTDGGLDVTAIDLTLFQQEILYHLAEDGPDYGLGIKRALQDRYGEEVNHGRLYPNLDELVEMGLIEKSTRDKRTNEYALTGTGKRLLDSDATRRYVIAQDLDAPVAADYQRAGGDD